MAIRQLRINGTIYGWPSLTANILGLPLVGIQGIDYKDSQETDLIYGAGNYPVGIGLGNIKCDGKLTLLLNEVEALTRVAPNGRLQEIPPFDITVTFTGKSGELVTHKLRGCVFTENALSVKQGDKVIAVECPLLISFIEWK